MPRRAPWTIILLLLTSFTAAAADVTTLLRQFERHAAARDFAAAERVARQAVALRPASRDAALALANAILWQQRYAEARGAFSELLATNARDTEARLGLANAFYWSGDLRRAEREFEQIASRPEAARALEEIRAASAPLGRVDTLLRTDSQPLVTSRFEAAGSVFSDPLTRWDGAAGTYLFDSDGRAANAPFVRGAVESAFPSIHTTLRASATLLRFADGQSRPLGSVGVDRRWRSSTLSLTAARRELFGAAAAMETHPWADSVELRWSRANAAVRAESIRYFDANRGVAADGWFLVPLGAVSLGASAALRDTDESRFVTAGVYDPYWTPLDLREVRFIVTASRQVGRAAARVHLDGGIADEAINGRYEPWRVALSIDIPLGAGTIQLHGGRESTVFYTANEFRASLARRF